MEKHFDNTQKAYLYINSWKPYLESYETMFLGKDVKGVTVFLDDNKKPESASFTWKTDDGIGYSTMEFEEVRKEQRPKKQLMKILKDELNI